MWKLGRVLKAFACLALSACALAVPLRLAPAQTVAVNNASSVLAADHKAGETTLVLRAGDGALFGTPTPSAPVLVTVVSRSTLAGGQIVPNSTRTIYQVTGRTVDTLTGIAAVEGTSDRAYRANDPVANLITAGMLNGILASVPSDASLLHKIGDETADGVKTFAAQQIIKGAAVAAGGDRWNVQTSTGATLVKVDLDGTLYHDLAVATNGYLRKASPKITSGPHTNVLWAEGLSDFPGQLDGSTHHVMSMGWNCKADGSRLDLNEVMVRDVWEYRWQSDTLTYQTERHIGEITFPDGIGGSGLVAIRPITFNVYHTGPNARKVTHNQAGTSWGYSSEDLTRILYSLGLDASGNLSATYNGAANVPGWRLALGTSGDTLSFGRSASSSSQFSILGASTFISMTSASGSAAFRLGTGSADLEIIAGGTVGLTIAGANRAATFASTVAATSFSGSGAGLTSLTAANISAGTAGINISGNAATATTVASVSVPGPILSNVTTGGGPNAYEARGTANALLWFVDSNGNLAVNNANSRLTLGSANNVSVSHDGANGTLQNNVGSYTILNTSATGSVAVATNNTFRLTIDFTGLFTVWDGGNLAVGTTTGTKIGTGSTQKLGFWGATAVVQPSTTGTSTGFTAGGGTTATSTSTYTGGVGASAYTVGDLVKHLKTMGLLAQFCLLPAGARGLRRCRGDRLAA